MEAHIRVHQEFIKPESLKEFLQTYCTRWYIALEVEASRAHYQGYISVKPEYRSLESLRRLLKKRLEEGSVGNKAYSISAARESMTRHIAYLMKEGYEPWSDRFKI
jgi:hypothetical protein